MFRELIPWGQLLIIQDNIQSVLCLPKTKIYLSTMATKYLETGIKQITETLKAYINIAQSMPKIQYKSGASNCIYSIKNALMFPN